MGTTVLVQAPPLRHPIRVEFFESHLTVGVKSRGGSEVREMSHVLRQLWWQDDEGQDIAEYAVMLAVILVIVIGTIQLVGSNANNVFSQVASSIQ